MNFISSKNFKFFDPRILNFNFQEFKRLPKTQITSTRAIAFHSMSELNLENVSVYYNEKIKQIIDNDKKILNKWLNKLLSIDNEITSAIETFSDNYDEVTFNFESFLIEKPENVRFGNLILKNFDKKSSQLLKTWNKIEKLTYKFISKIQNETDPIKTDKVISK